MGTPEAPTRAAFDNPVLVARLTMVRLLEVVDELERAAARQDPWAVARLATLAHEKLEQAEAAVGRVVKDLERDLETVARALADPTDLTPDERQAIAEGHLAGCGWDGRPGSCATPHACAQAYADQVMAAYQADGR